MTEAASRRLRAGLIDLAIMVAWTGLVAAVLVGLHLAGLTGGLGPLPLLLIGLALVVLPVTIGLTIAEAGRYEATPGKLKYGLRVRTPAGERIAWPRSLGRNLLKFGIPWALAQLALATVVSGGGWDAWLGVAIAIGVPVAYLASLITGDGRTIYDHLAGTEVIETVPGRRFA